jgi:hypothetical protein
MTNKQKKKSEEKTEPVYYMTLVVETTSTGGEAIEGDCYDRTPRILTHNIQYLRKQSFIKNEYGDVQVSKEIYDAEKVYAVITYYTEYDTFSSTKGNIRLESVHETLELANKKAAEVEQSGEWKHWGISLDHIEIHEFSPEETPPIETKFRFVRH